MSPVSRPSTERPLLVTVTGEPFQPVRLYYTIPGKSLVTRTFARLRCMDEDRAGGRWVWLYQAEAEGLPLGKPRAALPDEVHPVVIGAVRFPQGEQMTLELRSFARAVEAARFFGPVLGPGVVLRRGRVVNRFFEAAEMQGGLDALDRILDRDVTVIDPGDIEERLRRAIAGGKTPAEAFAELRKERGDVPLVEDFPLHPEEETPGFDHLATTLRLRILRAHEHWMGNTGVTLAGLIERLVAQTAEGHPSGRRPSRPKRKKARSGR